MPSSKFWYALLSHVTHLFKEALLEGWKSAIGRILHFSEFRQGETPLNLSSNFANQLSATLPPPPLYFDLLWLYVSSVVNARRLGRHSLLMEVCTSAEAVFSPVSPTNWPMCCSAASSPSIRPEFVPYCLHCRGSKPTRPPRGYYCFMFFPSQLCTSRNN
jgi:hypothetical protein